MARRFEVIPVWVAVMLVDPMATAVSKPVVLTVAAAVLEEFQIAELVRFCVLLSLKVPVAVSCSVLARTIELLGAVIAIDCNVAAVIVNERVFDVTPPCAALMLVEPTPVPVATPVLLMVAAAVFEEVQVAELVRFLVLPSLNVPVAVN
jgi:hypothetical protein